MTRYPKGFYLLNEILSITMLIPIVYPCTTGVFETLARLYGMAVMQRAPQEQWQVWSLPENKTGCAGACEMSGAGDMVTETPPETGSIAATQKWRPDGTGHCAIVYYGDKYEIIIDSSEATKTAPAKPLGGRIVPAGTWAANASRVYYSKLRKVPLARSRPHELE